MNLWTNVEHTASSPGQKERSENTANSSSRESENTLWHISRMIFCFSHYIDCIKICTNVISLTFFSPCFQSTLRDWYDCKNSQSTHLFDSGYFVYQITIARVTMIIIFIVQIHHTYLLPGQLDLCSLCEYLSAPARQLFR